MNNKLNTVPYNTGKIKIGCHYQPPTKNYMDDEAVHWQNVLTGVHTTRRTQRVQFTLYVAALITVLIIVGVAS